MWTKRRQCSRAHLRSYFEKEKLPPTFTGVRLWWSLLQESPKSYSWTSKSLYLKFGLGESDGEQALPGAWLYTDKVTPMPGLTPAEEATWTHNCFRVDCLLAELSNARMPLFESLQEDGSEREGHRKGAR
jgi:hypothetical protein